MPAPNKNSLTDKQKRFCEEYVVDFNATQAAIRAGYSQKTADKQGYQLLEKTRVRDQIKTLQEGLSDKTSITAEKVVNEFAKIAFHNPKNLYDEEGRLIPIQSLPEDVAAGLSEIKTKHYTSKMDPNMTLIETSYKLHSKTSALDSLGKHLGIFERDNNQKSKGSVIILPSNNRDDSRG